MSVSPILFERLHAGITRETLAAASGLDVAVLEAAERCERELSPAEEETRRRGLRRAVEEILSRSEAAS